MDNDTHVDRSIPYDLFPTRENSYTTKWAETSFKYCHLFLPTVNYEQIKGDKDIERWQKRGLEIRSELCAYGCHIGKQYLLEIAAKRYNLKFDGHKDISPTSVDDVVNIFSNPIFYRDDIEVRREQLYSLMYGIFRNGDNMWLMKGEQTKMDEYRVRYQPVRKKNGIDLVHRKGCFYRALKMNFSQRISRKFQIMMQRHHGEYITSRKKDIKKSEDKRVITKLHLSKASVWLVKEKNGVHNDLESDDALMIHGQKWVSRCKTLGYTSLEIMNKVKHWMSEENADEESNLGKLIIYIIPKNDYIFNSSTNF